MANLVLLSKKSKKDPSNFYEAYHIKGKICKLLYRSDDNKFSTDQSVEFIPNILYWSDLVPIKGIFKSN